MTQAMSSNEGATKDVFKDLNMSQDEISRFSEAFKKEEFRKLFKEYVDELQNPEQRALYEKEIAQLEEERGMEVEFIHPTAGHVLKLSEAGGRKVFINICTSDKIKVATVQRSERNGKPGASWSIPHSFAPPREDLDKGKRTCLVVDAVFHPDTYLMASRNAQFKKLVEDTAVQGAEQNFQLKFAQGSGVVIRRPKMTFKGVPQATVIRRKRQDFEDKQAQLKADPNPFVRHDDQTQSGETPLEGREFELHDGKGSSAPAASEPEKPKHTVKYCYRSEVADFAYSSPGEAADGTCSPGASRPHSVQVTVELPGVPSAQAIDVDVQEREVRLSCELPTRFRLHLKLPYPVTEENGSAKFDRRAQQLTLVLPCLPAPEETPQVATAAPEPDSAVQRPLIQELPSAVSTGATAEEAEDSATAVASAAGDATISPGAAPAGFGSLPPRDALRCRQTASHVTLLIGAKNVQSESILHGSGGGGSAGCWSLSFASVGSGGWRSEFSLAIPVTKPALTFESLNCGADNLIVRFAKTPGDGTAWLEELPVCSQEAPGSPEIVLRMPNHVKQLTDCLSRYAVPVAAPQTVAAYSGQSVLVTELSAERLCVRLDGQGEDVRERLQPQLQPQLPLQPQPRPQGILKCTRSPSVSSSDELSSSLSSSQGGQQLLMSQQSLQLQQQQQQHAMFNRSVSFSDHVESANFSSTASISAFHHTLRNRKKRQKQRETRRRRHNSDTTGGVDLTGADVRSPGGRIRRTSEGCSASPAAAAATVEDDDPDELDSDELESPRSPPPPPQTVPKPSSVALRPPQPQVGQQLQPPLQLTSSVIFELDDD